MERLIHKRRFLLRDVQVSNQFGTLFLSLLMVVLGVWPLQARAQEDVFIDRNGDEQFQFTAFGDSLVSGVGDGTVPGQFIEEAPLVRGGFPPRVETLLSLPVFNQGSPGEVFTDGGLFRLVSLSQNSTSDGFIILEGTNDALFQVGPARFRTTLQKAVNVLRAQEYQVLLATLPPSCCNRESQRPFERALSQEIREVQRLNANGTRLVDCERAFDFLCPDPQVCPLFNQPEGLHPNTEGYKVISELVSASALGIDLFTESGAGDLESALGLEEGTVTRLVPQPVEESATE